LEWEKGSGSRAREVRRRPLDVAFRRDGSFCKRAAARQPGNVKSEFDLELTFWEREKESSTWN
jgi:predicted secreted Zn-dependent protease